MVSGEISCSVEVQVFSMMEQSVAHLNPSSTFASTPVPSSVAGNGVCSSANDQGRTPGKVVFLSLEWVSVTF